MNQGDEDGDRPAGTQQQLAHLVKTRRKAAGMSRAALAQRLGLSESTLKNLERGAHRPTQPTLQALLTMPELGITAAELLPTDPGAPPAVSAKDSIMNSLIAPGYDPLRMVMELQRILKAPGGTIEQSYLYFDAKSAQDWLELSNQRQYAQQRELRHLLDLVDVVQGRVAHDGLDVLGLGCGDGVKEVRLVQHLLLTHIQEVRLYLLDISHPLLGTAFKRAIDVLPPGSSAFALQGDFHRLPFYETVLARPQEAPRRRLVCMFGGTFGNLGNELMFVRNNLAGCRPGDLLLLHVGRVRAPREDPEAVVRLDPHLSGLPADLAALERQWLTGPIERFSRAVGDPLADMEVEARFDTTSCPVPGSYAIEKAVLIKDRAPARRFVVTYVKRYEPRQLAIALQALGWEQVKTWDREVGDHLLCLFERLN